MSGAANGSQAAPARRLYHCPDTRSFRVLWALEELKLDYSLEILAFPPRIAAPSYLQINALGTVPGFFDGETKMSESSAIVQYLADRYGSDFSVPVGSPDYGAYLNALHFGEATLTFPQAIVLRYALFEHPARLSPQVAKDYAQWFLGRLEQAPIPSAEQGFIVGGRFTAADISIGYALKLAAKNGLLADASEPARAYWKRLEALPSYQSAMRVQAQAAIASDVKPTKIPGDIIREKLGLPPAEEL